MYNLCMMRGYNLMPEPSFFRGLASLGNLTGTIVFDESTTPEEADMKALSSDWETVGEDIRMAMNEYEKR